MLKDDVARRIFQKYLRRGLDGKSVETIEQSFHRVAMGIATYDYQPDEFYPEILETMTSLEFVPNRPAWFGLGKSFGFTSACTFLNVEDSLDSIVTSLTDATRIQQAGGGVGWNMSEIRPAGSLVRSTGGKASGPISFIKAFNSTLAQIQQGGWMMGANNVSLDVNHPDIEEFVNAKIEDEDLDQFNTNVLADDEFLARAFGAWDTEEKALLNKITYAMWKNGGLGIQFVDTANKANMIPGYGPLLGTNPCLEFWLFDRESCQPGYINLVKCLDEERRVDWDKLAELARIGTRCMDNLIDANRYIDAAPKLKEMAQATRRMGIGPTGLADILILKGIRYDSNEALDLAGQVMEWILFHAMTESVRLSKERGPFPLIGKSVFAPDNFTWQQPKPFADHTADLGRPQIAWDNLVEQMKQHGIRNCGHTVCAPSSFGAQTLSTEGYSIEPIFAPAYDHHHGDKTTDTNMSELAGMPAFMAAHQVSSSAHVNMVAAIMPFVTESISKTVNLPKTATRRDVLDIIRDAWAKKLKSIIVYRSGSRKVEPLTPCIECAEAME